MNNCKSLFELSRSWVNVPFRWHGYTKLGVDCIGLVVGVLYENNIISDNFLQKFKRYRYGNNLEKVDFNKMFRDLFQYFIEVNEEQSADLLLTKCKNSPIHFIIFEKGKEQRNASIIHVNQQVNNVFLTKFDKNLKIIKLFQLKSWK